MTHVVGKPAPSSPHPKHLCHYSRGPGYRNSPFSSLSVAVAISSTHCAYSQTGGQAELAWCLY